ncbi:MAG: type I glyceraldehyde-3-phosphate dehydrogenase [Alphaproteobacteria bacterium]|nr:type I glyceraldehyde-3-phosphate dehydrogenase [Alphaproteobacteria bacterium]
MTQKKTRVAINGFGRIGRLVLRALHESNRQDIEVVGINDLAPAETNAYLLKYDTAHRQFSKDIRTLGQTLIIGEDNIPTFSEKDPQNLPWKDLKVDVVAECTGIFTSKELASAHLIAGAKRVLISAPGKNVDRTVVFGVNSDTITSEDRIFSNASCTTNCLAPVVKVLQETFGISRGYMTTIHSYTSDQRLVDLSHKSDLRRGRAAAMSMIPTSTGAAKAVGLVLPELKGKLDGCSIRVPTVNVSTVDLKCVLNKNATIEDVNFAMKKASETTLQGILAYNTEELVSVDFMHNPHSSIFDSTQTTVIEGNFLRIMSWYDNEWGFSNRMLDTIQAIAQKM